MNKELRFSSGNNFIYRYNFDFKSLLGKYLVNRISYIEFDKEDDPFYSGHSEIWYHRDVVIDYKYDFYYDSITSDKQVGAGRFEDAYTKKDNYSMKELSIYFYEIEEAEGTIKLGVFDFLYESNFKFIPNNDGGGLHFEDNVGEYEEYGIRNVKIEFSTYDK